MLLLNLHLGPVIREFGKVKFLKNQIFLWLMTNNAILTRDNLKQRKWQGDPNCVFFCDREEIISHLFFQCPVAKVIWGIVAKCFATHNIPMNLQ